MNILRKIFNIMKGRPSLQPFLRKLHPSLFSAMGIGDGGETETSGEMLALRYIKGKLVRTPKLTLFDVGANVGNYSKLLVKIFPDSDIFAFEPSNETFQLLRKLSASSLKMFNLGLSDRKEITLLHVNKNNSGIASMYKRNLSGKHALTEAEEIKVDTIDNFCFQNKITYIDLLKLDVEGNELKCLQGARRMLSENKIKFIQFEFGGCNIDSRTFFRDFHELLTDKYKIYRIMQHGLCEITGYSENYELFITTNYLAEHRQISKK